MTSLEPARLHQWVVDINRAASTQQTTVQQRIAEQLLAVGTPALAHLAMLHLTRLSHEHAVALCNVLTPSLAASTLVAARRAVLEANAESLIDRLDAETIYMLLLLPKALPKAIRMALEVRFFEIADPTISAAAVSTIQDLSMEARYRLTETIENAPSRSTAGEIVE